MFFIFLKVSSLIESKVETIKERIGASRISLIPKSIITCWVYVAKTMKAVFSSEFTTEDYEILQKCSSKMKSILRKFYNEVLSTTLMPIKWSKALIYPIPKPGDWNLDPNKHILSHY